MSGLALLSAQEVNGRVTHEELALRLREMEDPIKGVRTLGPPSDRENSKPYEPENLLTRSEVLRRGDLATLVPKRAIIHLPDAQKSALGLLGQSVKLVPWADFYRVNRQWIATVEVTRHQAEGLEPLSEDVIKGFERETRVVVATYLSGPISVLPYVPPEKD